MGSAPHLIADAAWIASRGSKPWVFISLRESLMMFSSTEMRSKPLKFTRASPTSRAWSMPRIFLTIQITSSTVSVDVDAPPSPSSILVSSLRAFRPGSVGFSVAWMNTFESR